MRDLFGDEDAAARRLLSGSTKPLMALRLLRYEVNIWSRWVVEHPKAKKLPAILPVVLYHGASRWTPARNFLSLISLPPALLEQWRRYLPSFE